METMSSKDDFFEVKSMSGTTYVRASHIVSVNAFDQTKCSVILTGGTSVTGQETAKELMKRLRAFLAERAQERALEREQAKGDLAENAEENAE